MHVSIAGNTFISGKTILALPIKSKLQNISKVLEYLQKSSLRNLGSFRFRGVSTEI